MADIFIVYLSNAPSLCLFRFGQLYLCAGIGQDVVLSIPRGWCDLGGNWNAGSLVCDSV